MRNNPLAEREPLQREVEAHGGPQDIVFVCLVGRGEEEFECLVTFASMSLALGQDDGSRKEACQGEVRVS